MSDEGLGSLTRASEPDLAGGDELRERLVGKKDDAVLLRDRELLARDRLARVAEHVSVLEPHVREEDDTSP